MRAFLIPAAIILGIAIVGSAPTPTDHLSRTTDIAFNHLNGGEAGRTWHP